ncbi:hypothetical protein ACFY4K_12910 [Streptomyces leeuwenhoekii]|uniref:hypothetical protein n=1 Tax=Streptomyces leeuwenhoekii TaxID=1437453 RepID=UPI0036856BC2
MADQQGDSGFSIKMCDLPVTLPARDDSEWSLREILEWAPRHSDWQAKRICVAGCGVTCLEVPEGTLIEVPTEDALDMRLVAPAEVERRLAENRLWRTDPE